MEVAVVVAIDRMAQRYCKLPTEIMTNATTFDFQIMDITESYYNYQKVIQETGHAPSPKLTEAQMLDLMAKAKRSKK
jgi:hypothetical protein